MPTCWPVEYRETLEVHEQVYVTMEPPLEDVEPAATPAAISPYGLDFSLMAIVFAILCFLWIQ